jgi:hypothetical protein
MPSYLVESYLASSEAEERVARERRAVTAAGQLTREMTRVRFDQSIHIPADETCFYVFDAPSAADAAEAARRAGLNPIRVVEAISSRKENR